MASITLTTTDEAVLADLLEVAEGTFDPEDEVTAALTDLQKIKKYVISLLKNRINQLRTNKARQQLSITQVTDEIT